MNNNRKLKIGLDYHGVIDINVAFFSSFCTEAKNHGHSICIITGGPKVLVEEKLIQYNIKHDFVYAISDYYQALNQVIQTENGKLIIPDELWNNAKADFCNRNNVDLHIDDNIEYLQVFSTPYCYYNQTNHKGIMSSGDEIDFRASPKQILDKIEQILK